MSAEERNALIEHYFNRGYKYLSIQSILQANHNMTIGQRQLKRIISNLGLHRREHYSDLSEVYNYIEEELKRSGQMHGYRFMHQKCIQAGFRVPQKYVAEAVRILDPDGVALRKRRRLVRRRYHAKGPNSVWHIDSYDKLKPYGICINGCIDGFSRYVVWAKAYHTNSDPSVIGTYFLDAVAHLGGSPCKIRTDAGTENTTISRIQKFLTDNEDSVIVGVSTSNVRIESWWGQYRKANTEFYISLFQGLMAEGLFSGDLLDKELIRFAFINVVQEDLERFVNLWNHHRLRPSHNETAASGRPSFMYECPQAYDTSDDLIPVDSDQEETCREVTKTLDDLPCDQDVFDLAIDAMLQVDMEAPKNSDDALKVYKHVRQAIRS